MIDLVDAVANSILYEGYMLWPYRRSALKNQRRWTFGCLFPRAYSETGHADDAWLMRTECLVEADSRATIDVTLRFLHLVDRRVGSLDGTSVTFVDSLSVDDRHYVAWQEATERTLTCSIGVRATPRHERVAIEGGESEEPLRNRLGKTVGVVARRWEALRGDVAISIAELANGLFRLRVDVANDSEWAHESRDATLARTFISTHVLLRASGGAFVSLTDPPAEHVSAAAACRNVGAWPVLVGAPGARDTMLSSPIILPDYPEVATESGGDFFDAAEIDQLLVLNVLSLTPDEQDEMRAADPRTAAILDRCLSATPADLRALHGVTREVGSSA